MAVRRGARREEILRIAVRAFADRGFHGVSVDDIGAAAGVSGPALYHHFRGKEAILSAALVPVSEYLLAEGRRRVAAATDARAAVAAVAALVEFHVEFAIANPATITVHTRDLDRLPDDARREVRRLQRAYVEEWVAALTAARPELGEARARVAAHAVLGLINSTPFQAPDVAGDDLAATLRSMALAALLCPAEGSCPSV
jgi:AcrR family transcriptional regulator